MSAQKIGFVYAHMHWDIEWYQPFQAFRFWLAKILDALPPLCAREPRYRSFVLDGAVAPLDHYLAVRPERAAAMRRLVRTGRLAIGPFYTQFDEWLVSPEALLRNAVYGLRRAHAYGGAMRAGYLPDNFGHPRQLPQMLRGLGLDSLLFMRGMPDRPRGVGDQFWWRGLDGTRVLAIHFSRTYANVANLGHTAKWPAPIFRAAPYGEWCQTPEPHHAAARADALDQGADELIAAARALERLCPSGVIPLANGYDHAPAQTHLAAFIARANRRQRTYRFVQGDCQALAEAVRRSGARLPTYAGDLYGARYQLILTGTLALRSYLKQANFAAESLMEKYAEPLAAWAALRGATYPRTWMEEAWRFLFVNHAHDGIHGSSVDAVHTEMMQRFASARQIAVGVCHESLAHLAAAAPPRADGHRAGILVFNPAPRAVTGRVVEVWLPRQERPFRVEDERGRSLPLQAVPNPWAAHAPSSTVSYSPPWPDGDPQHWLVQAPLAAHGLTPLFLAPGAAPAAPWPWRCTDRCVENAHLRVTVRGGALDVYDKQTRRRYRGLGTIEDEADGGDAWDFSEPWRANRRYRSTAFPCVSRLVERGPVRVRLRLRIRMRVPRALIGERRSRETTVLPLELEVSLTRDSRAVHVSLSFDHQARDHRLRLLCPTGLRSREVWSQSHFGRLSRPLRNPDAGRTGWRQPPPATFPFREWVAVEDGRRGLALAARGLYEYESRAERGGVTLYVTLLRAVGRMGKAHMRARAGATSPTPPTPDAQCPGPQRFEWAFMPYACDGETARAAWMNEVEAFLYPPLAHMATPDPSRPAPPPTSVDAPVFDLSPANLRVSGFKRAEDGRGWILRFWENEGRAVTARLALHPDFRRAWLTDLKEERLRVIPIRRRFDAAGRPRGGRLTLRVGAYRIVTVRLSSFTE